jgi:hypothetical protein
MNINSTKSAQLSGNDSDSNEHTRNSLPNRVSEADKSTNREKTKKVKASVKKTIGRFLYLN